MFELRLEGTRRPELQAELNEIFGAELDNNIAFHLDHREFGLPGDRAGVILLYFAMLGLILDEITAPAVLGRFDLDDLLTTMVTRLLPEKEAGD
ncbi:MAG: hypothetical protein GEV11_23780 [Streptosporangiales bacterium]|nr:hypothetical protein [Streptosporangiales bacterium]